MLPLPRRPLLNFFGYWGSPKQVSGGGGSRRRLAEAPSSSSELDSTTSVLAPDRAGSDGDGLVSAQSTAWCTAQGWWAEQIAAGRVAAPADLQAAQVTARRTGRMR